MNVNNKEGGAPFIVMELLRGEELGTILRRRGPLPAAEVVELLSPVSFAQLLGGEHAAAGPYSVLVTLAFFGTAAGSSLVRRRSS